MSTTRSNVVLDLTAHPQMTGAKGYSDAVALTWMRQIAEGLAMPHYITSLMHARKKYLQVWPWLIIVPHACTFVRNTYMTIPTDLLKFCTYDCRNNILHA